MSGGYRGVRIVRALFLPNLELSGRTNRPGSLPGRTIGAYDSPGSILYFPIGLTERTACSGPYFSKKNSSFHAENTSRWTKHFYRRLLARYYSGGTYQSALGIGSDTNKPRIIEDDILRHPVPIIPVSTRSPSRGEHPCGLNNCSECAFVAEQHPQGLDNCPEWAFVAGQLNSQQCCVDRYALCVCGSIFAGHD